MTPCRCKPQPARTHTVLRRPQDNSLVFIFCLFFWEQQESRQKRYNLPKLLLFFLFVYLKNNLSLWKSHLLLYFSLPSKLVHQKFKGTVHQKHKPAWVLSVCLKFWGEPLRGLENHSDSTWSHLVSQNTAAFVSLLWNKSCCFVSWIYLVIYYFHIFIFQLAYKSVALWHILPLSQSEAWEMGVKKNCCFKKNWLLTVRAEAENFRYLRLAGTSFVLLVAPKTQLWNWKQCLFKCHDTGPLNSHPVILYLSLDCDKVRHHLNGTKSSSCIC